MKNIINNLTSNIIMTSINSHYNTDNINSAIIN